MCIDILIREASNGNRGILSVMKELSLTYGKNKPFKDDEIISEIVEMTYPSIEEFLKTHVIGNTPINYDILFDKAGLAMQKKKIETNYVQNGNELLFAGKMATGSIFQTQ